MSNLNSADENKIIRGFAVKCGIPVFALMVLATIVSRFPEQVKGGVYFFLDGLLDICIWFYELVNSIFNYGGYLKAWLTSVVSLIMDIPLLGFIFVALGCLWLLCINCKLSLVGIESSKLVIAHFMSLFTLTVLLMLAAFSDRPDVEKVWIIATMLLVVASHLIAAIGCVYVKERRASEVSTD
jgi:hypothetical protein